MTLSAVTMTHFLEILKRLIQNLKKISMYVWFPYKLHSIVLPVVSKELTMSHRMGDRQFFLCWFCLVAEMLGIPCFITSVHFYVIILTGKKSDVEGLCSVDSKAAIQETNIWRFLLFLNRSLESYKKVQKTWVLLYHRLLNHMLLI